MKLKYLIILLFGILSSCSKNDSIKVYEVIINSNVGGEVSISGGSYDEGTLLNVTATPEFGYVFTNWSNGSTDNPIQLTVNRDLNLTANFQEVDYKELFMERWGNTIWTRHTNFVNGLTKQPEIDFYLKFNLSEVSLYSFGLYKDWSELISSLSAESLSSLLNYVDENYIEKICTYLPNEGFGKVRTFEFLGEDKFLVTETSTESASKRITKFIVDKESDTIRLFEYLEYYNEDQVLYFQETLIHTITESSKLECF